jgi:hypothetical protein
LRMLNFAQDASIFFARDCPANRTLSGLFLTEVTIDVLEETCGESFSCQKMTWLGGALKKEAKKKCMAPQASPE